MIDIYFAAKSVLLIRNTAFIFAKLETSVASSLSENRDKILAWIKDQGIYCQLLTDI